MRSFLARVRIQPGPSNNGSGEDDAGEENLCEFVVGRGDATEALKAAKMRSKIGARNERDQRLTSRTRWKDIFDVTLGQEVRSRLVSSDVPTAPKWAIAV